MNPYICPTKTCPEGTACPTTDKTNPQICKQCEIFNCKRCSASLLGKCQACRYGYYLENNACKPCTANCENCGSRGCSNCIPGYIVKDGQCVKCVQDCNICSGQWVCKDCNPGYFKDRFHNCQPCSLGCSECTSKRSCSRCLPDHNFINKVCQKCPENCTNCEDNKCYECVEGYRAIDDVCQPCPESCKKCSSHQECQICKDGYLLDMKSNTCTLCKANCRACSSKDVCGLCKDHHDLVGGECVPSECNTNNLCGPTQFCDAKSTGSTCVNCMEGCDSCNTLEVCSRCSTGYLKKDNRCLKCSQNCQQCSAADTCDECLDGYRFTTDDQCVKDQCTSIRGCPDGQQCEKLDSGNVCIQCPDLCKVCSDKDTCTECFGHARFNSDRKCVQDFCNEMFRCASGSFCQSQIIGNRCQQCPDYCLACDSEISCTQCKNKASLVDGACLPLINKMSSGSIIGIAVGIIAVVGIVIGGVVYAVQMKKKSNLVQKNSNVKPNKQNIQFQIDESVKILTKTE
ncbi:Cysteine-rich membrane protein 2 [Spironucleus salmonicida]|uniref:Cysteine-rich membrane protein 2 n=1 Tax=Spironucleus salmonicida TaxID=348837 RepID=V6LLD8_9EUKA|nr:Cysteine-rich membrane protein 2 [Spironucleus salmonicida]|eukprot:EST45372.1 Cysteine-rich membrane protein 2 [Spironucleus salmonicida]